MKYSKSLSRFRRRKPNRRSGFALVITISLMVILTLLAVGLLALSSVSLRGSRSGDSMREARANARLALELAIGQLQKQAGPDRRITAPASMVKESAPLGVTGVWEASTSNELVEAVGEKDGKFVDWLVSDAFRSEAVGSTMPPMPEATDEGVVTLLGEDSFGPSAGADAEGQYLRSKPLEIQTGRSYGKLAWGVIDESLKARFDLEEPVELAEGSTLAKKIARASSPARFGTFALDQLQDLRPDEVLAKKLVSFDSAVLGTNNTSLRNYRSDITPWSLSLMTNPVDGGFKRDLSTAFTVNPQSFESEGSLYQHVGLPNDSNSDPSLATLVDYHNLYKEIGERTSFARNVRSDAVGASLPNGLRPFSKSGTSYTANPQVPRGMVLMPSLLKVDMVFSIVARVPHTGYWKSQHTALKNDFMIHLMYLPVITLHNPYDTPISFEGMKLSFQDIPVGFKFYNNKRPATSSLITLSDLVLPEYQGNGKTFGITVKQSLSGSDATTVTLEPGQTRVFGTIAVNPTWSWADEISSSGNKVLFDWQSDRTPQFEMIPGLMSDPTSGAGFDVDYIAPSNQTAMASAFCAGGTVGAKRTDRIGVEWGPLANSKMEFNIVMELNGQAAGMYRMSYGDQKNLDEMAAEGTSERYPDTREFPMTWPDGSSPDVRAQEIYEADSTPFSAYSRARPFAIMSFTGKTTRESFVPTRPYVDSSTNLFVADMDISSGAGAPGDQPYEMVMVPVEPSTPSIGVGVEESEGYFFGGHDSDRGTSKATFYEIPHAPMQSLAQFRHANLANSGVPPFMTYTVGESWANPMIPAGEVSGSNPTGSGKIYDHAYLSNAALWDRYFLSTMADYEGDSFQGDDRGADEVREDFFSQTRELLNPRMVPLVATTEGAAAAESIGGTDGDKLVGKYVGLKGGFNVNSTSVDAWVAFLSSMRDTQIANQEDGLVDSGDSSAFPRVRHPADGPIEGGDSFFSEREPRWQGYRQLDATQIQALAENLVDEIHQRGPFLSLAEFVNRRLGGQNDASSRRGALAAAIHETEVNATIEGDGLDLEAQNMGDHDWVNPSAALGNNSEGAPGSLTQGDILSALGSEMTVRGDTFVIRAYGQSDNKQGTIQARAWCEAVVQRMPDYVDPTDVAETELDELSPINEKFGRRFEVRSFRWLVAEEI
ncbi:hypothetical protein HNR46_000613 [Haloferula luteola]|uniref:Verru_Chthon cassette protein A n=1 Tax=Haloferula luteola TaxID=595692 RepID=A0A840V9C7_9BACT|nr:hypothetical protein [Haloferula luteola]MBB5350389.1 hypothetical protein [Haloferula luteola]